MTTTRTHTPNPPRVAYHDTQRLTAADLQADSDHEAQMRRLHVIGLHNTWGVALGLEVGVQNDGQSVLVGPGMAYDYKGREIILSDEISLPTPAAAPSAGKLVWFDLVISYDTFEGPPQARDIGAACPTTPLRPNAERPVFRWAFAGSAEEDRKPPLAASVRQGVEIPLARVRVVTDQTIVNGLDLLHRRTAQALVRPHIAGDQVVTTAPSSSTTELSWAVYVNTADYGFSSVAPHYFVQLTDHPLRGQQGSASLSYPAFLDQIYGPFITLESPSRWGFTLRVRFALPEAGTGHDTSAALRAMLRSIEELPLAFNWTGTEPVTGCQPPFTGYSIGFIYTLFLPELFTPIFFG